MTRRMLIDAAHPEETRVVVVQDRQLVDFDFESATKRQLKGNIYLAKVTRVEPSLQAAFVDYGGNRHGFLPFSEIHADYYQIPQADRVMLEQLESDAASKAAVAAEAEQDRESQAPAEADTTEITQDADEETADVVDEFARRRSKLLRSYKIQEVIKRRQILLVQVVKEERGNKGAALTTYLSLAGRYCVLMPNTPRGGGISRKISNPADRRRLKSIAQELEVPHGMGLIIRTAGAERLKSEIKRDYEYLLRLWNEIRETTLKSIAPALIYEEGDLVKRALRDLYTRDIEEVLVEGESGYRSARRLMQMLMPSRARLIKQYDDEVPLFYRYQVEDQLDRMYSPTVQLPSGGSIVIHATEALTAIDVNSGRSTRERHIDETAVKTNLEAADEVARQLRLRDLAGLIVIDFIDMAENRHQRQVEKRFKDALKADRARIQIGKISQFGLLELSRQRLRPSLQELSTQLCPTCAGLGVVRSTESCALQALRIIQDAGIKREAAALKVSLPVDVGLYILNHKRDLLVRLEQRYEMRVFVNLSEDILPPNLEIEVLERREEQTAPAAEAEAPAAAEEVAEQPVETPTVQAADENGGKKRRRRRRRRRGPEQQPGAQPDEAGSEELEERVEGEVEAERLPPPVPAEAIEQAQEPSEVVASEEPDKGPVDVASEAASEQPVVEEQPPARRRRRAPRRRAPAPAPEEAASAVAAPENTADEGHRPAGEAAEAAHEEAPVTISGADTAQPVAPDVVDEAQASEIPPEASQPIEEPPASGTMSPDMAAEGVEPEDAPREAAAETAAAAGEEPPLATPGEPYVEESRIDDRPHDGAEQPTPEESVAQEPAEEHPTPQQDEQPEQEPALAEGGDEEKRPVRQGWWSRWVR